MSKKRDQLFLQLKQNVGPEQLGWTFEKRGQYGQRVYRLGNVLAYFSAGSHQKPGIWVKYDDETIIRYQYTTWWEVTDQVEAYLKGVGV